MPESDILIYIVAEVALLLLLVTGFLLYYVKGLRKLITQLEERVVSQRQNLRNSQQQNRELQQALAEKPVVEPRSFLDYIEDEITLTREHHQSLNPDRDIVLDISQESPLERQAASLRHAFLLAEKEALYAGDGGKTSWDVLDAKLGQIIAFYESEQPPAVSAGNDDEEIQPLDIEQSGAADSALEEEIANYKKRIENLEKFKKLFFEMEKKWEASNRQADEYHEQILAMGMQLGGGEHFQDLMESYSRSYADFGLVMNDAAEAGRDDQVKVIERRTEVTVEKSRSGPTVIANQEEIDRLKNMAVDQHKVIIGLKKQLLEAKSAEAREKLIEELAAELEKQERFLKEAETCTELLENELSRTVAENETLRQQLEEGTVSDSMQEDFERMKTMVADLTNESKEMLNTIAVLERENQQLKSQAGVSTEGDSQALQKKLRDLRQELLNLQTQHIELEERYLELKTRA